MKRTSQITEGTAGQPATSGVTTYLPSSSGDEHSWHIDCEKCHLVADRLTRRRLTLETHESDHR